MWPRCGGKNACRLDVHHPAIIELRKKHKLPPYSKKRKHSSEETETPVASTAEGNSVQWTDSRALDSDGEDIYV